MKQLLANPLIIVLIALIGLIYFIIAFQIINSKSRWSKLFEQISATLFIMIIGGVSIKMMTKFHPKVFFLQKTSLATLGINLVVYSACLVILLPRLSRTLKDSIYVVASLLRQNLFFCLYLLLFCLSFIFSNLPGYTLKAIIIFISITLALIYIGKQYSWKQIFSMLTIYHGIAVIIFLVFGKRELGHKNYVGPTMAMSAIILYLQSTNLSKHYKLLFIILAVVSFFCVQEAESGMGRALMVILIFLLGFLRFIKRLPPRTAFAFMGIFLAIGVSLAILITENAEYIIVEKLDKDMTLTGRTLFWPLIVDAINKHPLFGYGYLGFWQKDRGPADPSFNIRNPSNGYTPMHSHNGYLDIGVSFGWIGLTLFIISLLINIFYGVKYLIKTNDYTSQLPLIIFTWLIISNVTETNIIALSSGWTFYVLMTTRLCMDSNLKDSSESTDTQESLATESISSSSLISSTEDRNNLRD